MSAVSSLLIILLLSFSYMLIYRCFNNKWLRDYAGYSLYVWGVILLAVSLVVKDNMIYALPHKLEAILLPFVVILVLNIIAARYSGYRPVGRFHIFNFVFIYPLLEEMLFRGIILPIFTKLLSPTEWIELLWLPITMPVLLTALLFAISHLQYYKLSRQSVIYMLFAFIGGTIFGAMTAATGSIWPSLLLHIQFNAMCVLHSRRFGAAAEQFKE
ncbi:CPBP family intramembrane glutamic endopeptidase [Paenibacillus aquistagni]|uniref:CAAX protease self-immunity n=1 Tax=Paenibacillus aquistagni TaxID=1852522 RepID=A0A1X7K0E0_9BACL|nr:CPBP family intramembrane glutamic endopeptidase [Paenibacillus aquistagni]SMG34325.1 CAAX protease self-immunity [Paenibacillus aquistagni]